MRLARVTVVVAMTLGLASALMADDDINITGGDHNGRWWQQQSLEVKIGYLLGFVEGVVRGADETEFKHAQAIKDKLARDLAVIKDHSKALDTEAEMFPNKLTYMEI